MFSSQNFSKGYVHAYMSSFLLIAASFFDVDLSQRASNALISSSVKNRLEFGQNIPKNMFQKHLSFAFSSMVSKTSLIIFFFDMTVSSSVLSICTINKLATLFVTISFSGSQIDLTTTFLSFASRTLKSEHATRRPCFEARRVGNFSFILSANHLTLSASVWHTMQSLIIAQTKECLLIPFSTNFWTIFSSFSNIYSASYGFFSRCCLSVIVSDGFD